MKKLLGIVFIGTTSIASLNAQATDEKTNFSLQEEPTFRKKIQVSDDKDIWKFNALGTLFNGFNISYERKLASKWSLNVNSVTNLQSSGANAQNLFGVSWILRPDNWYNTDIYQSLTLQMRYYHNLEKRQRKGKRTGFSGNYFAFELGGAYTLNNSSDRYYSWLYSGSSYSASLLYGIQRKISEHVYIDASVGLRISHYNTMEQSYNTNYSGNFIMPVAKLGVGFSF